ncbi:sulfurtransferase [Streptomyces pluripotens]|uniref:Sulfurtransferase n=1 Tax=Streptomyces pluripotens TaxID=1355015 RepID=A0A221P4G1_9ACTN|nr:sulfurtransferase [Streptomyces pluripotens]ASN27042.1 sulfurtransferase [Streptomyces pluripotens]
MTPEGFAAAWVDGALVVDIRKADEHAAGHVPGTRLMALRTLPTRCGEPPLGRPVFANCASGNRRRTVADRLNSRGFDAYSVTGGTGTWVRAGRPVAAGSYAHAA